MMANALPIAALYPALFHNMAQVDFDKHTVKVNGRTVSLEFFHEGLNSRQGQHAVFGVERLDRSFRFQRGNTHKCKPLPFLIAS